LGLAYKANVDDDRESPSYEIIELLVAGGARVDYCDPWFPTSRKTRKHDIGMRTVPCDNATFQAYDAVVIATAHDAFKAPGLFDGAGLIVDTRNIVAPLVAAGGRGPKRLVKA
jgi:UDP-N-acetyl-D-glucosamine dehydrogenase